MALSTDERQLCRKHLGYMSVKARRTFALGVPAIAPVLYVLESAMDDVLEVAEPDIRQSLAELECILKQKSDLRRTAVVRSIGGASAGGIGFRPDGEAQDILDREYRWWQTFLADQLGVDPNPFSRLTRELQNGFQGVAEPF